MGLLTLISLSSTWESTTPQAEKLGHAGTEARPKAEHVQHPGARFWLGSALVGLSSTSSGPLLAELGRLGRDVDPVQAGGIFAQDLPGLVGPGRMNHGLHCNAYSAGSLVMDEQPLHRQCLAFKVDNQRSGEAAVEAELG